MVKAIVGLIRFYRRFISPFKRPCCRFYPTCSEYAIEAIREYGLVFGVFLALKRLLKCHPFHPGGYDSVIADDLVRSLEFGVRRKRKHNY